MTEKSSNGIVPSREENYPEWYQQVIKAADLAENSPVRGCMVIKPWGYAIWENMQRILDGKFKASGHKNAYFPLFIPLSFLQKEAAHVEGFAKECAVVTHHRLEQDPEGNLVPAGELEEPLVVRPTSETVIGASFSKWVESYRDLPLLINQWANVVRWEMRTRVFLRTTEFLWQEGHTAHATEAEAVEETRQMLDLYEEFAKHYLAIPVVKGEKTASERFPGAVATYTIEAMMQDRKALQTGTSHFLGQNFAKASEIRFRDEKGDLRYAWTTSWGVTTRMIGAVVMVHADDDGMVLPPRIASLQVVILPVVHKEESRRAVTAACRNLANELSKVSYFGAPLQVLCDEKEMRGGEKVWSWIKKGVPIRIEIGPRDLANGQVSLYRRDRPRKEVTSLPLDEAATAIPRLLDEIHEEMYQKALSFRNLHIRLIDDREEFYRFFTPKNREHPEIHGGFALCHWSEDKEAEEQIKKDLNVTVRCIPLDPVLDASLDCGEEGVCIMTGKKSRKRVIFGKSY